jgi:L-ascorbate metabolism protein UlaG (beta-lactamase superfamily)
MRGAKFILGIAFSLFAVLNVAAQSKSFKFHGKPDYYLQVQSEYAFKLVDEGLDAFPPVVGSPIERKLALYNLDALLHDTRNDNTEAFRDFVNSRITKLLADLDKPMKRGMRIYKIYNEAFIVRTKSVTVAFDISRCRCRGHKDPIIPDELAQKLVAKCDAMFLTHNHGDHVDSHVADLFIAAGKPVVATPNILVDKAGVTHRRTEGEVEKFDLTLSNGKKLDITIFPGFQGKLLNNVYVVTTPEKYTVCHTGDMSDKRKFKWLATVKDEAPQIDALIVNCWTGRIDKVIEGFNPRYVITGHENEMGHSIDHREAFWLSFAKLADIPYNYVVTAWGEWFTVK